MVCPDRILWGFKSDCNSNHTRFQNPGRSNFTRTATSGTRGEVSLLRSIDVGPPVASKEAITFLLSFKRCVSQIKSLPVKTQ